MRVTVLYFGVLKERFGAAGGPVQLAEGATVGELVRELQARTSNPLMSSEFDSGTDGHLWQSLAVAVNREYASLDAVLREGDEVALLPPVSGGYDCFVQGESLAPLGPARTASRTTAGER